MFSRVALVQLTQLKEEAEAKHDAPVLMLDFVPVRFPGRTKGTTYGLGESHGSRSRKET